MRKITREAAAALREGRSYSNSNTTVTSTGGEPTLYLHGSPIARRTDKGVMITTAGYNTVTTRERLSPFAGVHTRKGQLMIDGVPWDGAWRLAE